MEISIPHHIKEYLYESILKKHFNLFKKINPNSQDTKSYSPILITSSNSYLSKELVENILQYIFPSEKLLTSNYEHKLSSNKTILFNVKTSRNHIEINPSEYGISDRAIVGEYIAEASSMNNIITGNKKNIIVWNIDKLGTIAFEILQNVIRNNEDTANFICVCNNPNKMDKSILSILFPIDIENPKENFYKHFCDKFYPDINYEVFMKQIKLGFSEYNFNSFLKQIGINANFGKSMDYKNTLKNYVDKLYYKLTSKSKISDLYIEEIRSVLYDLYVYHFSYEDIVNIIINNIISDMRICKNKKIDILEKACEFNTTCNKGNKQVIHVEAFIYNFLHIFWNPRKIKT